MGAYGVWDRGWGTMGNAHVQGRQQCRWRKCRDTTEARVSVTHIHDHVLLIPLARQQPTPPLSITYIPPPPTSTHPQLPLNCSLQCLGLTPPSALLNPPHTTHGSQAHCPLKRYADHLAPQHNIPPPYLNPHVCVALMIACLLLYEYHVWVWFHLDMR